MLREILFKRKMTKNGITIVKVSKGVVRLYKKQVKGNELLSDRQVEIKLARNWILSQLSFDSKSIQIRCYGNLELTYSKSRNEIVNILNNKGHNLHNHIDMKERARLTKLMGIKEDR